MTISVWRYSHLALAVSSFLFLLLASITGIILAAEPVNDRMPNHRSAQFDELQVSQVLPAVKGSFSEVTSLSVDSRDFVTVKGMDENGDNQTVYVDPKTGKILGEVKEKSAFFQWVTALHRSLFLHELGRFFIGLAAFLLLLITISGTILLIQRQRGIKRFFTRIVKDSPAQYFHVVFGRFMLIPVLIIALSGTYLSLVRFGLFPEKQVKHQIEFSDAEMNNLILPDTLAVFNKIPLADVRVIEFPFSDDPEDYYLVKLKDRELAIDQYTGTTLSEVKYPFTQLMTNLSLDLHTGRANIWWAVVLGIACINILYFMYSGCVITLKRLSGKTKNPFKPEESKFILLVGSENGSTLRFAKAVHEQLLKNGQASFLCELNKYTYFPQAEHIVVLASTYGLGDAPVNASRFLSLLKKYPQEQAVHFSVVGFGSHAYPDFCKFAYDVHDELLLQTWATPLLDMHTVNDRSLEQFNQWFHRWSQKVELPMLELPASLQQSPTGLASFRVTERTELSHNEGSFLIRMQPVKRARYTSGDILDIYPANDHRERQYSIGRVGGVIQLSVRLHEHGLGSGFLYRLQPGELINGRIEQHTSFHFPRKTTRVIMIANGTGIAPFLGMIDQNKKKRECYLYAGFRSRPSFQLYEQSIDQYRIEGKLTGLNIAYSREEKKQYVSDLILNDANFVATTLSEGGVIMLCGSLAMEKDIIAILDKICLEHTARSVSHYQSNGQIVSDCY